MKRIKPNLKLADEPCLAVSVSCAKQEIWSASQLEAACNYKVKFKRNGYMTLNDAKTAIKTLFDIKEYKYISGERTPLINYKFLNAIVLVSGHFIFVKGNEYYSFFNNDYDSVIAYWEV